MSKSILDAGWGEFLSILQVKAANAVRSMSLAEVVMAIVVNSNGTTQNCSSCSTHIPKTIADRWHSFYVCGLELDRDVNAAINIKNIAVGRTGIKAQDISYAIVGFTFVARTVPSTPTAYTILLNA